MDTNDAGLIDGGDPEDLVGTRFADRYELLRFASSGANTLIFDADDTSSGRTVTLKIVHPDLAVVSTFRERFDHTIHAVAALSHPNISAIYDWGEGSLGSSRTVYVANERLTAGSLRDMFDRGRRLSPSQALAVGLDVCKGLDYAHRRGFVHTELTPSKIVFGDDRRPRIVDFGFAALLGEHAWSEPATVATHVARYSSPEQALSLPVDDKTDVYALCLVLVEAVTGTLPFASESTVATLSARVGRLMPVSADLGPLASVLERAGRPDPEDRSTAAEFGRSLVRAAEKLPRPEPLPLLSTGRFDVPAEELRTPEDPTGGVARPAAAAGLLVVPLDEPGAAPPDEATADVEDGSATPAESLPEPEGTAAAVGAAAGSAELDAPTSAPVVPVEEVAPEALDPDLGALPAVGTDDLVIVPIDADGPASESPAADANLDAPVDDTTMLAAGDDTIEAVDTLDTADTIRSPGTTVAQPAPPPRRRMRALWVVLGALLTIAALAALVLLALRLFSTSTHEVPELEGLEASAAREQIADFGWEVTERTERSDAEPRADHVIRTNPGAGTDLAEGEPFLLVISEGPVLRPLPEVTGMVFAEAQTALVELGLEVVPLERNDETVPAGNVVAWSVPGQPGLVAGDEVEPGTQVQVVVSLGPAPRTVPDLTNAAAADARAAVEELQLVYAEGEAVFSDTVPAGAVLSQTPAPGEQVERGSTVQVVLSRGPDVVPFPELSGMSYEQASTTLTQAGFAPVLRLGSTDGAFYSATIDGQPAVVGQSYRRGTQVDLIFL